MEGLVKIPENYTLSVLTPKNMVSTCCINLISQIISSNGGIVSSIRPGKVEFYHDLSAHSSSYFSDLLKGAGFEPATGRDEQLLEKIKLAVIELVHKAGNVNSIIRNSDYLVERLGLSYTYLSALFSKSEHITLERFIILHKIEKAKELIEYEELTLSEIANQLGYSSVQYLSNQFKQVTGVSVSEYKKSDIGRIPIDKVGK